VALYPPRANGIYRAVIAGLLVAVTAAIVAPMVYIRTRYAGGQTDPVQQPIEFDHRHHARDDGIDCVYCHTTVETEKAAGIPSTERCMGCHGQIWPESPKLKPLRDSWMTGIPIRWKRVNAVPGYVYFHHGVHVQAGLACAQCHGHVEDMPRVVRVHDLSMRFCMDCHRKTQGSRAITQLTNCTTCHR
jgi:hypothetical protein